MRLPGGKRPSGAAVCPWNNRIVVCIPDQKKVETYDSSGRLIHTTDHSADESLLYPTKVAFFEKEEQLLVLGKYRTKPS